MTDTLIIKLAPNHSYTNEQIEQLLPYLNKPINTTDLITIINNLPITFMNLKDDVMYIDQPGIH